MQKCANTINTPAYDAALCSLIEAAVRPDEMMRVENYSFKTFSASFCAAFSSRVFGPTLHLATPGRGHVDELWVLGADSVCGSACERRSQDAPCHGRVAGAEERDTGVQVAPTMEGRASSQRARSLL